MDEEQTKGTQIDLGGSVSGVTPVVVIFRMPDGSCDKGTARHVGSEAIFVESKRNIPIGTKVAICLAHPDGSMADWGTAEGMVIWTCPAVDQFNNGEGFGVSLQGRWPWPPQSAEAKGPSGAV
jgi:hypothetical protein